MIQKSISMDLWKEYRQPLDLVQYEAEGRTLNITLTNGGQVVDLTGASVTFNMTKGTDVIYNACTNVDETAGKISLLITGAICDTAGTFDAFIEIVKTDVVLRTQNFDVTVKPSVDNSGAIESTSEFTALQAELAQIAANESAIAANASDISDIAVDYVPRATFTDENIVIADGTDGDVKDSTKALSDLMDSVGSAVVDENIVVFDGTGGKTVKDSGIPYTNISNKNYIINGNFDVWQRGTSFSPVGTAYCADRWYYTSSGSTTNVTRETFAVGQTDVPNNPKYYFKAATTLGADYSTLRYRIEDVSMFSNEKVMLSFWIKGVDPHGGLEMYAVQSFGSGGSADVDTLLDTVTMTSSWVKHEIEIDIPSIAGKTIGTGSFIELKWRQGADTSTDAWDINLAQVKLEKGSVATPFVPKSLREETADCQRYYYKVGRALNNPLGNGYAGSTTAGNFVISFPIKMRTSPTSIEQSGTATDYKIFHSGTATTCSSVPTFEQASEDGARFTFTVASGLTVGRGGHAISATPNGYLAWSAEL